MTNLSVTSLNDCRHIEKIQRIKAKLTTAQKADKEFKVFGAEHHQYRLKPPVPEHEVSAFEERFSTALPGSYRCFLTLLGNGGPSYCGSGAGPFYGIYPLGQCLDDLAENPESYLNKPAMIHPTMTDKEWGKLIERIENDDDISDDEYEREREHIFGGLLPIGSQGCTGIHALVLNGPHSGRVVNLDTDFRPPKFAFEMNFLDWYERWLDEAIAAHLPKNGPTC